MDALADGPLVVGHGDWRVEHLRFDGGALSAVYDWDSLAVAPAAVFAGAAAHQFTADWSVPGHVCAPAFAESMAFLDDFAEARAFSGRERQVAHAAFVASLAYSARCANSDRLTACGTRPAADWAPDGDGLAVLRRHGAELLCAT